MLNLSSSFSVRSIPFAAVFAVLSLAAPALALEAGARLRIAFELSSGEVASLQAVARDVERLQQNSGNLSDITIVAFGGGVGLFRAGDESGIQNRLAKLADSGVDLIVCQDSLKEAEISNDEVLTFARTVKTGSKELERLEAQGWARIPEGESYVSHL